MDAVTHGNTPDTHANGRAERTNDGQVLDEAQVIEDQRVIDDRGSVAPPTGPSMVDPRAGRYMPGIAAFRHPIITLIPVLIFGLLGVAYGSSRTPTYSADARILVGRLDVTAQAVPGYVSATQSLAGVYSRLVSLPDVHRDALSRIGHPINPQSAVAASPIPGSSEIRVDATSPVQADAVRLANATVAAMVAYVDRLNAPTAVSGPTVTDLQAQFNDATAKMEAAAQTVDELNTQLSALRNPNSLLFNRLSSAARDALNTSIQQQLIPARAAVDQAREQMTQLDAQIRSLQVVQAAPVANSEGVTRAIQPAVASGVDRTRKLELDTGAGVAVGFVVGLLLATAYDALKRRRWRIPKVVWRSPA
jgi:uncharacterized protein involved in exopolysaccharide biosynthesis